MDASSSPRPTQTAETCRSRDLICSPLIAVPWVLTAALLGAQFLWPRAGAWLVAMIFLMWGVFCVSNAARCHRFHCYFTGPLFLATGAAFVLLALGVFRFPANRVALAIIVIAVALQLAEIPIGKYRVRP